MGKFADLKQAMKNPPPERLAQIEYRAHLLQAIGITTVCVILIVKGFWYIIFALIFGVGISYSQGMTAYQRYKIISSLQRKETVEDYEKDISPSRRRSKIVKWWFGNKTSYAVASIAILSTLFFIDPTASRLWISFAYPGLAVLFYIIIYFFILYYPANYFYKRRNKLGSDYDERG